MPQARYRNLRGLRLNSYGSGPFCEFRIPRDFHASGVYVLTVDDEAVYVGECDDLSARYNIGYGNISPRNCFEGGQMTNCRVNNLIYQAASAGKTIALWFFDTPKQKAVEADLIARLQPPWNRKGIATR